MSTDETTLTLPGKLRASLDRNRMSVAQLGRELAARDGHMPESKRRLVQKYLKGTVVPGPEIAHQLEEILTEPPGYFATPADPQERRDLETAWRLLDEIRLVVQELQRRLDVEG